MPCIQRSGLAQVGIASIQSSAAVMLSKHGAKEFAGEPALSSRLCCNPSGPCYANCRFQQTSGAKIFCRVLQATAGKLVEHSACTNLSPKIKCAEMAGSMHPGTANGF